MRRKIMIFCLMAMVVSTLCPASVRAQSGESGMPRETEEIVVTESIEQKTEYETLQTASGYNWDRMISNTVNWMRGSESQVLNDSFLSEVSSTYTDWYAFSLGRLGISDNYTGFLSAADSYVREMYEKNPSTGLSLYNATEWHRLIVAIQAAGGDPVSVGGRNLIADGVYNCLPGEPWEQGINGAIWALLAIDTKGYEVPEGSLYDRDDLISYILDNQLKRGGWNLSGRKADVDITAMAVQALAPYYAGDEAVQAAVDKGLVFLRDSISADGDLQTYGDYNCESTAQAIVAFASMGIDPGTVTSSGGKSLLDGLVKYYNASTGGFLHTIDQDQPEMSNVMATGQALYAIAAYRYYEQGLGLYDFRNPSDTTQYVVQANGVRYRAAAGANAEILVANDVTAITLEHVPVGNYDAALIRADGNEYTTFYRRADGSIPVDGEIPVSDGTVLNITVKRQDKTSEEWVLTVHMDASAAAKALISQIDALPDADTLTLNEADAVAAAKKAYDALSEDERAFVTNYGKLKELTEKIETLEALAEKQMMQARINLKKKVDAVSVPIKISDKTQINQYLLELDSLGEWEEKASLEKRLRGYLADIAARQKILDTLDEDIWNQIDPLRIDQKIADTVNRLMNRYNNLRSEEQSMLKNGASLLEAADVIKSLTEGIIPARVFQNMRSTKEDFTYYGVLKDGGTYTLTYDASGVQSVSDVSARVQILPGDDTVSGSAARVVFEQSGSMNGSVTLDAKISVSAGTWKLYWMNPDKLTVQSAKTASVSSGSLKMTVSMGGTYWLTKEGTSVILKNTGTKNDTAGSTTKQASASTVKKKTSASGTGKTASDQKKTEKEGVISSSELKEIQGKNINLQVAGTLSDTISYTITINGTDVERTQDFIYNIKTDCKNKEDIEALAVNPLILCMDDMGELPGRILLTLTTELEDDTMLLFRYDPDLRQAEYVKKVQIKDGVIEFTLDQAADYFIASQALAGSLNDPDTEEEQEFIKEESDTGEVRKSGEDVVAETEEIHAGKTAVIIIIIAAAFFVTGGAVYKKKKGELGSEKK